jgi:hypothetical protein
MSLRKRAIIINCCIVLVLLVEFHFHSAAIVGIAGILVLVVANGTLLVRARWERRRDRDLAHKR